ncbi:hypothetical protein Acor_36160 [Acrocarpospora corrugata]|uniref:Caspase family p20 domain-containing protein n=1 Tax=Acrocarpospora corrugata TaxID=35763 RepID=A0A5M3W0J4_9ACTN|nr:caspase family protein [Acrocarpospora corrugata]GES01552.1 hypothetical protein Acor_36160 [Acrocarpospora corrugata]
MSGIRRALIVANDEYADPGLAPLRAPNQDALALAEVLGAKDIGGFEVETRRNATAHELRVSIEDFFADSARDDLLFLHFSGHGLKSPAGELYLSASDTRADRLASTAIPAEYVSRLMLEARAQRVVLFLDCCYGGAFPRGMMVRGTRDAAVGDAFLRQKRTTTESGRVVVTASSAIEYALEGRDVVSDAELRPSIFTSAVVSGLTSGDADHDGDGWVGVRELFDYVADRVRQETPHQTPHIWVFGAQGDVLMARAKTRRIREVAVPTVLAEAMESPLAGARFGVVHELREHLMGDDLGQALTASKMLARLADDDSRLVSRAAVALLAESRLQATPPAIDFGTFELATWSEPVEVSLTGPPLACAVTVIPSHAWIHTEIADSLVMVRVYGETLGPAEGSVILTSPLGETTISCTASVQGGGATSTWPMRRVWPLADFSGPVPEPSPPRQAPAATPIEDHPNRFAGVWPRLAAGLVDGMIFYVLMGLSGALAYALFPSVFDMETGEVTDNGFAFVVTAFASVASTFLYGFLSLRKYGRTIGKAMFGLRVVEIGREQVRGINGKPAYLRALPLALPMALTGIPEQGFAFGVWCAWLACLIWMLVSDPGPRSLLDRLAETVVVRADS